MGEWQQCGNNAVWKGDGIQVELWGEGVRFVSDDLKKVGIADIAVPEWRELWVQVEPKAQSVWFGEEEASEKPNGWWAFTFRNYLGKSSHPHPVR
jgi:hypothetical protein